MKEFLEGTLQHLMSMQNQLMNSESFADRHDLVHQFDIIMEAVSKELHKLDAGVI